MAQLTYEFNKVNNCIHTNPVTIAVVLAIAGTIFPAIIFVCCSSEIGIL